MNSDGGLIVRRTTRETSNRFVVRLAENVSREADFYDLVKEGIEVEIVDIENDDDGSLFTTLRVRASDGFDIQRVELLERPKEEKTVCIETLEWKGLDELKEKRLTMTSKDLEEKKAELRDVETSLRRKLDRLKQDRALAVEKGYHFANNDNHHRWTLISEELRTVSEQAQDVRTAVSDLNREIKSRNKESSEKGRSDYDEALMKLCEAELGKKFEVLKEKAQTGLSAA